MIFYIVPLCGANHPGDTGFTKTALSEKNYNSYIDEVVVSKSF